MIYADIYISKYLLLLSMSSLMAGPAHTSEIAAQTTGSTAATGHTDRVNYIILYIIVLIYIYILHNI